MLQAAKQPPLTPTAQSSQLKAINGQGRVQLYAMQLAQEITILVYNLYGWTNANCSKVVAQRTDTMIQAILEDMELQPP